MSNVPPVQAFHASGPGKRGRGRGRGRRQGRGGAGVQRGRGGRARGQGQRRVTCPACGMGFKFTLVPPLHVCCKECSKTWHTRCVRNGTGGGTEFICQDCSPHTPVATTAVSPPPVPVSRVQTPVATTIVPPAPERPVPASRLTDAAQVQTPASPVPGELLLSEPSDRLPSYKDNMRKFDAKIYEDGFKRSPTQMETPANGDCGPEAFIDQLNWKGTHDIHTRDSPGQNGVASLLLR